jgi:hypothetical protein
MNRLLKEMTSGIRLLQLASSENDARRHFPPSISVLTTAMNA